MKSQQVVKLVGIFGPVELKRVIRALGREGFAFDDLRKAGRNDVVCFRRGRTCRHCGCSEKNACVKFNIETVKEILTGARDGDTFEPRGDACHWIDDHTCSHCSG